MFLMEPTQPTEGLDPDAVKSAGKIMQAAKHEHEARQAFEDALAQAGLKGAEALLVREDVRKPLHERSVTSEEMMDAAQAHRQAEQDVGIALGKLLDASIMTSHLRLSTPGEFAFGFDPQPTTEVKP